LATVEYWLAAAYKDRGDFTKANEVMADCLKDGGNSSAVYYLAGEIEEGAGNVTAAEMLYTRAGNRPQPGKTNVSIAAATRAAQLHQTEQDHHVQSLGRWDPKRLPLRVYIDDGTGVVGYQPSMRLDAMDAFNAWTQASGGQLTFTFIGKGKAEGHDVREDWSKGMKDPGRDIHLHWRAVIPFKDKEPLGVTYPQTIGGYKIPIIAYADIYLATNETPQGGTYASRTNGILSKEQEDAHEHQLQSVTLHEIGHALGLAHSNLRSDIMTPIIFGALASRIAVKPTLNQSDQRAITAVYKDATAEQPDKFDPSIVSFSQVTSATAINAYSTALEHYKIGHYNNAVLCLESALKASPNDANLHLLLGDCFYKQGRTPQARVELERVIALSPDTQAGQAAKALITAMDAKPH
jgi:tetratricopeptide (TPR) repeat protein